VSISKYPSQLSLPQNSQGYSSVLEYLIVKFPCINRQIWLQRMADGKVHWHDGSLIAAETLYRPQQRVYYYREVENETLIPFEEKILYQDEHILVAYKPHFLQVTPGGSFVNECLQNRLRRRTGNDSLQAMHRLDRETAGLVLFSTNTETRQHYHNLFATRQIHKTYQAIARINTGGNLTGQQWEVKNRLVRSEPRFITKSTTGIANSHSIIRCLEQSIDKALFELIPVTGKTHQLRSHMQTLGWPLLYDKYYPALQAESADDYSRPLQLLAKELRFIDPISHRAMAFFSNTVLSVNHPD